jgi:mono/diheme cytochrome c family protein
MTLFGIRDVVVALVARRHVVRRSLPLVVSSLLGCSSAATHAEGLEPATLPVELRADYAVFAQRCSKCHSLARPLNSGISDENYWSLYVARMRRQPGSGISQEDAEPILRFLHYYSVEQTRKPEKAVPPPATSSSRLGRTPRPLRM